jgi:predicted nucleotidyltransferase
MAEPSAHTTAVSARIEDPVLAEIVSRLVGIYRPERIYLFGSRARGAARRDSDYDLMLVMPDETPPARLRSAAAYTALWGMRASVDVLVWTRTAFDERLHLRASLPSTVAREGRLIYSA